MRFVAIPRNDAKAKAQPLTWAIGQRLAQEIVKQKISFRQLEIRLNIPIGTISRLASLNVKKGNFLHVHLEALEEIVLYLGYKSLGAFISKVEAGVE